MPTDTGDPAQYAPSGKALPIVPPPSPFNRVAYSAAHVVADPLSDLEPSQGPAIDWDRTIAYRRYLLDLGLGIAEAMDTAQRGMGLSWTGALELIKRTLEGTRDIPGAMIFSGCGTDQLDPVDARDLDDVAAAYFEQIEAVQSLNGRIILMASRALARVARSRDDYFAVYSRILPACDQPVILHWLGNMFDPALTGYWGSTAFEPALENCLAIIEENKDKVDGIKVSLLDKDKEIIMRRRLPAGVRMYTGDDFNYPELIAGTGDEYSDALLGIFDAIAPAASLALSALAKDDEDRFFTLLDPTVPLSRLIFRAPTQYYKTGVVFLAYLNGHQDHFVMLGGQQSMRPLPYFCDIFRQADQAGLLRDPDAAVSRMGDFLRLYGVDA